MQVERQPEITEIKGLAGWRSLRTSLIYEFRKTIFASVVQSNPKGLAAFRGVCPLEAVLVDLQRLDLRFQSRSGNAQSGRGS
jgi:hypothetical protein